MDARSINIKSFIAEIQKRPAIWDQTCEDYNNKEQKFDDWQELTLMFIPKEENFTPGEVKTFTTTLQRRWKNLRDCYTRELLRLMKVKTGDLTGRKRGYIYYKQLSFLRKVVKPSKRSNDKITPSELELLKSVLDADDAPPPAEDPLQGVEVEKSDRTLKEEFQNSVSNYDCLLGSVNEDDFSLSASFTTDVRNNMNENCMKVQSARPSQRNKTHDSDKLFLLSLVEDFQSLPEEQRLMVKIQFLEVIKKAKKGTPKRNKNLTSQSQQHSQVTTVKDEAESDSYIDIDETSLDSVREPTTPELLEEDNVQ